MTDSFLTSYYESPLGLIELKSVNEKMCSVLFVEKETEPSYHKSPVNNECVKQLKEYFAGTRQQFNIPHYQIGTDFQKKVWQAVEKIAYGTTLSYSAIAYQLGDAKSVRAVGTSNGKNQLAIIVPCHRVLGADGQLTGYAWGIERKQWLLKHEIEHAGYIEGRLF